MKSSKSYKEAILRAYPTEKDTTQPQEHLLHLKQQAGQAAAASEKYTDDAILNESHVNLMRSWMNLRGLDQKLAGKPKQGRR